MPEKPQDDPVLKRFRTAVTEIYGDRLQRVVLFGSPARGDAQPDSDYDGAVFLSDLPDRASELLNSGKLQLQRHRGSTPSTRHPAARA